MTFVADCVADSCSDVFYGSTLRILGDGLWRRVPLPVHCDRPDYIGNRTLNRKLDILVAALGQTVRLPLASLMLHGLLWFPGIYTTDIYYLLILRTTHSANPLIVGRA